MENKILVIIDVQNDFISGSLGNEETKVIPEKIVEHLKNNNYSEIYVTLDTHDEEKYLNSLEGKKLPIKHCISGTVGADIPKTLKNILYGMPYKKVKYLEKETFATFKWNSPRAFFGMHNSDEIVICGVCTDICVISNALLLRGLHPDTKITVLKDCCAGTTIENHEAALKVMESCQIDVL